MVTIKRNSFYTLEDAHKIMTDEARKRLITWGVDGYGVKWFLCNNCKKELGNVDYWEINHECKEDIDEA